MPLRRSEFCVPFQSLFLDSHALLAQHIPMRLSLFLCFFLATGVSAQIFTVHPHPLATAPIRPIPDDATTMPATDLPLPILDAIGTARLADARTAIAAGRWNDAADAFHDLLTTQVNTLIQIEPSPVATAPSTDTRHVIYWGMELLLREELAGGRPELRAALLAKYPLDAKLIIGGADRYPTSATGTRTTQAAWSIYGGNDPHNGVAHADVRSPRLAYTIPRLLPDGPETNPSKLATAVAQGGLSSIFPVSDGSSIFYQDGLTISALDLATGQPLAAWLKTYPAGKGQYTAFSRKPDLNQLLMSGRHCLTLTDATLFGIVGLPNFGARPGDSEPAADKVAATHLVCLDRATGREVWVQGAPAGGNFTGSPLVIGPLIYVVIVNAGATADWPSEHYQVRCCQRDTGKVCWNCQFCALSRPDTPYAIHNIFIDLCAADGLLFVANHHGLVAAIDANTGHLAWISTYSRISWPPVAQSTMQRTADFPWESSAPVVDQGNLLVLPDDATCLMAYQSTNGRPLNRIPLTDLVGNPRDADAPRALLAILGERAILACGRELLCVRWRNWHPGMRRYDALDWSMPFPEYMTGCPSISEKTIIVPTQRAIYTVDILSGKVRLRYPATGELGDAESPGNILACANAWIVAGARNITVYSDTATTPPTSRMTTVK